METQNNPLISIGIPTFNGEKYIAEAIQSVLNQSYHNLEVIISDNCSTDNTRAIVEALQKKDPRVKYFRQHSNIGYIKNFNFIPPKALGDYFIFFADDDVYDADYIKLLWQEFVKTPSIVLAMGSIVLITPDKVEIEHINDFVGAQVKSTVGLSPVQRVAKTIVQCKTKEWAWGINLALFKKEVVLRNPYNQKLTDPGTQFCRSVVYEGDIGVNVKAIFYKREGGLSGAKNYGRPHVTIQSSFNDAKSQYLQFYYEFKTILTSTFSIKDKMKLVAVFYRYRIFALSKATFLYTASFFSFLIVKYPYRWIMKTLLKKMD